MAKPFLSIIIPNYNEMANLEVGVLNKVRDFLKTAKFSYEVIISDDGSSDKSLEYLTDFVKKYPQFRLLKNAHTGKAGAIKSGIENSNGEFILFTDMDQSTPLTEIDKLIPWFEKGYKAVIGSRGRKRQASIFRQIAAISFLTFRKTLLLSQITDTQCGFKAFEANLLKKTFPKLSNFNKVEIAHGWKVSAFDVELLFLIEKQGEKIKEVTVNWRDEDISTNKSRNFLTESVDMLKQVLKVKLKNLKGEYDQQNW
jgi:glycosyltransferase involved in cell wall biosynthesis